jgi:hypothetical protein
MTRPKTALKIAYRPISPLAGAIEARISRLPKNPYMHYLTLPIG